MDDLGQQLESFEQPPMQQMQNRARGKAMDPEVIELVKYLDEVIEDYRVRVEAIGKMKYAAPQLLYYRDEVQDLLDALSAEQVDLRSRWAKVRDLDLQLRGKAPIFVNEVGHSNFKQYQIVNDPPVVRWWWYLNRITVNRDKESPKWMWWK